MISAILLQINFSHDDMSDPDEHNKFIGPLILLVVFGFVLWKVWPLMKNGNIFNNKHDYEYARSEFTKKQRSFTPMQALATAFLLFACEVLN